MKILSFIGLFTWLSMCNAASFDCSKAASLPEMMICNDQELSILDDELSNIYQKAKQAVDNNKNFREQNKESWKWREANCYNRECLLNWYKQRKITLEELIRTNTGFLSGATAVSFLTLEEATKGSALKLKKSNEKYPDKIEIYYNQTRLDLTAVFKDGQRAHLPYKFELGYETDGEMHWEKKGNRYAIAQKDLTGDGIDEIIFVVLIDDDGMSQAEVNIFKYFPPKRASDFSRRENWALAGDLKAIGIAGDPMITLDENSITIPRNLRGFYYETTWVKNKFINTGSY